MDYSLPKQESAANSEAKGVLPALAPLANPYVPFQQEGAQTYQADTGLVRGTIYPGLDLPFMGMVNQKELSRSPGHQLQALHFAISELGQYLDTHSQDQEALELFNQYVERYEDALQHYEEQNGPVFQMSAGMSGSYDWINGPWPWEYDANKEG